MFNEDDPMIAKEIIGDTLWWRSLAGNALSRTASGRLPVGWSKSALEAFNWRPCFARSPKAAEDCDATAPPSSRSRTTPGSSCPDPGGGLPAERRVLQPRKVPPASRPLS